MEKLCRAAGKTNRWSVYPSVRIPDPDGGRREIDLILVSGTTVLVVEQKHWSGRFEVFEDGEFLQHRNKGGEHSHATVAHRIARKARLLEEIHRKRFPDNEMSFHVLVAMTHPRLEWPIRFQTFRLKWSTNDNCSIVFNRLEEENRFRLFRNDGWVWNMG